MADERVTLLVPSCDRYADLWAPFFALLRRHWPDCPFRVVVGSNHLPCAEAGAQALCIGDDVDWSRGVRAMVERVETPAVLVVLEDFLLRRRVDTAEVLARVDDFFRLDAAYLRMRPFPPPDVRLARFPAVGECEPGAPYRASMQAALWRKEDLLALLRDGENPWEFEVYGARRSDAFERGFYSAHTDVLDYYAAVTMGKWIPYGVALCRENGVAVDLAARPMMSPEEAMRRNVSRVTNEAFGLVPWKARERMLRWFRATGLRKPPTRITNAPRNNNGAG